MSFLFFIVSVLVVGLSHGIASSYFGFVSATLGYACFWQVMLKSSRRPYTRFWLAVFWFFLAQAIQLSWFVSIKYMGPLILVVYGGLIFFIALQFGLISLFFVRERLSLWGAFAIAGSGTLLEWLRTFYFSGFTWNPVGLALAGSSLSLPFASLVGVYGLSFWVLFVNAFALYVRKRWKQGMVWCLLAFIPFLYGIGWQAWVQARTATQFLQVALIQPAILPEQKEWMPGYEESYLPPLNQWERIWALFDQKRSVDMIVLPEAAVELRAYSCLYPVELVSLCWEDIFGEGSSKVFPALEEPFAKRDQKGVMKVSNAFLAKALANQFNASVISGFDHRIEGKNYNAAFHFSPEVGSVEVYEKRILVPVAEYIPFPKMSWLTEFLANQFGIGDSFSVGRGAKIFHASCPVGISICCEETYSHLSRELRKKGAQLFVNVTNDLWFPGTHLPRQHILHGQLRCAENGIPCLRACNSGVTAAIDCCGKRIEELPISEEDPGILYAEVPLRTVATPYLLWGNGVVLLVSFVFLMIGWAEIQRRRSSVSLEDTSLSS